MMTEACGATNCTMMEVGEAISRMMKVCGATKSTCGRTSSGWNPAFNLYIYT